MIPTYFIRVVLLAATLTAVLTGCATAPPSGSAAKYLQSPARARLLQPLAVEVFDRRPDSERTGAGASGYYHAAPDGGDPGRVASLFARDVHNILRQKRMATDVSILSAEEKLAPGSALLRIRLLSWFGRIPAPSAARKVAGVLGSTASYAEGQCAFEAELVTRDRETPLGSHHATVRFSVGGAAMADREGRLASAQAADEALAKFLRAFEDYLRRAP